MKRYLPFILSNWLTGCQNRPANDLEALPGVYTTYYNDEFSERFDTIKIKPVASRRSEAFLIEKRSTANKVLDDRIIPERTRIKRWDGPYDPHTGSIMLEPGKNLYFDREEQAVIIGNQRFQKVKAAS